MIADLFNNKAGLPKECYLCTTNTDGNYIDGQILMKIHGYDNSFLVELWGVGEGLTGHCYALQTMEGETSFRRAVATFIECAKQHPNLIFLVTAVGCGIAGYSPKEVAPMFQEAVNVPNVYLPKCFWDVIEGL